MGEGGWGTVAVFPAAPKDPFIHSLYAALARYGWRALYVDDPYSLTAMLSIRRRTKILHLHWVQGLYSGRGLFKYYSLIKFIYLLLLMKIVLRFKLVWTVHNVFPHESLGLLIERVARKVLYRVADVVVALCEAERAALIKVFGGREVKVIPQGNHVHLLKPVDKAMARKILGLPRDSRVFLFLGKIRPYKGVDLLIEAFSKLAAELDNVVLLVAGSPSKHFIYSFPNNKYFNFIRSGKLRLILRYVSWEEASILFSACDYAVYPYRQVWNSGSVMSALSCGRPVIIPRRGCLIHLPSEIAIFIDSSDVEGLYKALKAAALRPVDEAVCSKCLEYAMRFNWLKVAKAYAEVYRKLIAASS